MGIKSVIAAKVRGTCQRRGGIGEMDERNTFLFHVPGIRAAMGQANNIGGLTKRKGQSLPEMGVASPFPVAILIDQGLDQNPGMGRNIGSLKAPDNPV